MGIESVLYLDRTAVGEPQHRAAFFYFGFKAGQIDFPSRKFRGEFGGAGGGVLKDLGFPSADAWFPVNSETNLEFYVFYGIQFGRVQYQKNAVPATAEGPWQFSDKLTSLGKAGFDVVDAAVNVPGKDDEFYFFRGTNYVKIHLKDDRITSGPDTLANRWPHLVQAGFDCVDAIMRVPESDDEFFFFRGHTIATVKVTSGAPEQIVSGPEHVVLTWNGAFKFLEKSHY